MKKVLSGLVALVLVFSSCVVFAAGPDWECILVEPIDLRYLRIDPRNLWLDPMAPPPAVKGSEKEVIIELGSSDFDWSYAVDNAEMVNLVLQERIPFVGPFAGLMAPPVINRWHFEPLKEGDVTITFTCPVHYQRGYEKQFADGKEVSYTYHIDSKLNMELVSEERVTLPSPW